MTYQMQINGKGKMHDVADYAAASAKFRAEQERIGYRSPSDRTVWPRYAILFNGAIPVAHLSQNGKVWPGTVYVADDAPLYVPA